MKTIVFFLFYVNLTFFNVLTEHCAPSMMKYYTISSLLGSHVWEKSKKNLGYVILTNDWTERNHIFILQLNPAPTDLGGQKNFIFSVQDSIKANLRTKENN